MKTEPNPRDTLYNGKAERAVVGSLLIEPVAASAVIEIVQPGDFYLEDCRRAFEAELQLIRDGKPIDLTTLEAELVRRGHWAETGISFLSECQILESALHADAYASVVANLSMRRKVLDEGNRLARAATSSGGPSTSELALVAASLSKISSGVKPSDKIDRLLIHTDLETWEPLEPLDEIVCGVLAADHVVVWSGDGGIGKTYCAIDLCAAVSYNKPKWLDFDVKGGPALIVDEQSGHRRLVRRVREVLAGHEIVPQGHIAWLTFPHFKIVSEPQDADALREAIRAANARLVIVDSLLNIVESTGTINPENDSKRMADLFSVLRQIAIERKCGMVLLHHVNRSGGYRGSTAIKSESDGLVILSRADNSNIIRFKSEKMRDHDPLKFSTRLNFAPGVFNLSSTQAEATEEHFSKSENFVLRYLGKCSQSSIDDIMEQADSCSANAARNAVYSLVNRGYVRRADNGGAGVKASYALEKPALL